MASNINEQELRVKYSNFSENEIMNEYREIVSIPNARTNIDALTRMSVLLPIMEERGLKQATPSNQNYAAPEESSGVSWGSAILGLVLVVGGLALSANSGSVFYGAIIVGAIMLIKSFL